MCEEISIWRRWQHVSDRPPLLPPQSSDRALHVKRVLASAFDWNFLVILLYYILVKWVRCHLDVTWGLGDWNSSRNSPEPARQWVHGQLLTMTGRLSSSSSSSSSSKRNFARKYAFDSIFQALQDLHPSAPLQSQNFRKKIGLKKQQISWSFSKKNCKCRKIWKILSNFKNFS